MCDTSSARPARLLRYGQLCGAVADGLAERAGTLERAVDGYAARTEPAYRYDCGVVVDAVRELAGAVREVGEWVAGVGRGFLDAGQWVPIGDGVEAVASAADGALAPSIDAPLPRLRVVHRPPPDVAGIPSIDPQEGSGVGSRTGNASSAMSGIGETLVGLGRHEGDELAAITRVVDLEAVGRATNGVAVGLSALGAGMSAWDDGAALADDARIESVLLHAGLASGGGWAGGAAAGAACTATAIGAPLAPLCAIGGGLIGGWLGGRAAELLDDDPGPGEHDEDAVADEIADVDPEAVRAASEV